MVPKQLPLVAEERLDALSPPVGTASDEAAVLADVSVPTVEELRQELQRERALYVAWKKCGCPTR